MRMIFVILLFVTVGAFGQDSYWLFENNGNDATGSHPLTATSSAGYSTSPVLQGTYSGDVNVASGSRFISSSAFNFGTEGMTMIFAFLNDNTGAYLSLFDSRNGGDGMHIFADLYNNAIYIQTTDGVTTGQIGSALGAWTTGQWVVCAVRFMDTEGIYGKIFINGAQSGTDTTLFGGWSKNNYITLGGNTGGGSFYGNIDNWSIWTCALTDAEISDIYDNRTADYSSYGSCAGAPPEPPADADTLYVDAISGSDANNGATKATAIQTIDRANDLYLSYDVIAFSDTAHYGALDLNSWSGSGFDFKKITTYDLYGNGKAKLKGIKQLTSWTSLGSNKWEKVDTDLPDLRYFQIDDNAVPARYLRYKYFLNGIFIGGAIKNIAIEPEIISGGWSPYWRNESVAADYKSYMVDNDQSMSVNQYQGGYVYIGNEGWVGTKAEITSNTANTFNFNTADFFFYDLYSETNSAQHYYRVMNHLNCLDTDGEFVYDYTTNKVTLYHATNPSSLDIWVPYVDNVIRLRACTNVLIDGIEVWSGNIANINIDECNEVIVRNSNLFYGGYAAAAVTESQAVAFYNDSIMHSNGNGIAFTYSPDGRETVNNCYFYDIGYWGMSTDRDGYVSTAILSRWSNAEKYFYNNYEEKIGGNGISLADDGGTERSSYLVNNLINGTNYHLGDGAAIYVYSLNQNLPIKLIRNNTIRNSYGGPWGNSTDFSMGIYLDLDSYYWNVDTNNISTVPIGIFTQYGNDYNSYTGNKIAYTADGSASAYYQGGFFKEGTGDDATGITFTGNEIVQGYSPFHDYENCVHITNDGSPSWPGSTIDNNKYATPFSATARPFLSKTSTLTFYTLPNWTTYTGWEANSEVNPQTIMFADVDTINEYQFVYFPANWSSAGHYFNLGNCSFRDIDGNTVADSVLVGAFNAKLLFYASGDISSVESELYIPVPLPTIAPSTGVSMYRNTTRKYFYRNGLKLNTYRQ